MNDEVLVDKDHAWASRKPSKKSLQCAFNSRDLVISERQGMMQKAAHKNEILKRLEARVRKGALVPIKVEGVEKVQFWIEPFHLDGGIDDVDDLTHILSPFDPLVIQRKRFNMFFEYDHRFEAYLPKEKRKYGYFALPVIIGDQAVAVLDLKTDRQNQKLLIQQWLGKHKSQGNKQLIEQELQRFEKFQLAK